MNRIQKALFVLWLLLLATSLLVYLLFPDWFTAQQITETIAHFHSHMMLAYILFSLVRGLFLIPSTPFVLAGAMLFPSQHGLVLLISMLGVMAGVAYLYYCPELLGLDRVLQSKYGSRVDRIREGLNRYGLAIVAFWAFFPVFPTDLIAYVAGLLRMKPWKFFLGILIGELPLVTLYVYTGTVLREWLFA